MQIGSHGPAYSERYPPQFEVFKPACRSNQLQHCTAEEIVNAYDNSDRLHGLTCWRGRSTCCRRNASRFDSVLIYVSDHGESLGEQGIYLHGMPYAFAPRVQKEVPMLFWTSRGLCPSARGLSMSCVQARSHEPVSHDNLYHTVLGAAAVRNEVYDPALDILAGCRPRRGSTSTSDCPRLICRRSASNVAEADVHHRPRADRRHAGAATRLRFAASSRRIFRGSTASPCRG